MKFPSISLLILLLITALTSISCGDEANKAADASATGSAADSSSSTGASVSPSSSASAASITASAAAGNGYNTITWSSVTGASSYYLYWSTSSNLTTSNGTRLSNVTSPYTHSNLTNGTKVYYLVSAVSSGTEIGYSSVLDATPAGVSGVTAVSGNKNLSLSWGAIANASSYNLYFSTSSTATISSSSRITQATSPYTLTGLTNGTTYYVFLTAVISAVESAPSTKISKAPVNPPSTPANTSITVETITNPAPAGELAAMSFKDNISWSSVSGATSYAIYWSSSASVSPSNYSAKAISTSAYFQKDRGTDAGLFYYVVTALIENSESSASSSVNNGGVPPLQF